MRNFKWALLTFLCWPLTLANSYSASAPFLPYPAWLPTYVSAAYEVPLETARAVVGRVYDKALCLNVDAAVILAVVAVESGFRPDAKTKDGSGVGLMQINPRVHGKVPEGLRENLDKGIALLQEYVRQAGSLNRALVFYNQGPTSALQHCPSSSSCNTVYTRKVNQVRALIKAFEKSGA